MNDFKEKWNTWKTAAVNLLNREKQYVKRAKKRPLLLWILTIVSACVIGFGTLYYEAYAKKRQESYRQVYESLYLTFAEGMPTVFEYSPGSIDLSQYASDHNGTLTVQPSSLDLHKIGAIDAVYTISETDVTGYTFAGASVDNDGTFEVNEGTATGTGMIYAANTQYTVTYTNRTVTQNVSIWKTDLEHTAITTGAEFALYSTQDYDDTAEMPKDGAKPVVTGTTGKDGILTLGAIPVGEYRLVETRAPKGYNPASTAIRIIVGTEAVTAIQGTGMAEVAQDIEGNPYRQYWVAGQAAGTYQVRVWNNPGVELPATGGMGTSLYMISGIMLILGAAILYCVRLLRRCS